MLKDLFFENTVDLLFVFLRLMRYISISCSRPSAGGWRTMLIEDLLVRLRTLLVERVRNGELTERGLARRIGISQAHMHNVLKGVRILTPEVADLILLEIQMSASDLMEYAPLAPRKPPAKETAARGTQSAQVHPRATSR
jgi:transcriptional regulator with XRE-family HTH domain